MANDRKSPERELRLLYEALSEFVADTPEEGLQQKPRDLDEDPTAHAESVRSAMLKSVQRYRQRRLLRARLQYEESRSRLRPKTVDLPADVRDRRRLLERVLECESRYGHALLTAQHRDFASLSDEDVTSYLIQLAELGVLAKHLERDDGDG